MPNPRQGPESITSNAAIARLAGMKPRALPQFSQRTFSKKTVWWHWEQVKMFTGLPALKLKQRQSAMQAEHADAGFGSASLLDYAVGPIGFSAKALLLEYFL